VLTVLLNVSLFMLWMATSTTDILTFHPARTQRRVAHLICGAHCWVLRTHSERTAGHGNAF
jgi:hypothetical protein